MINIILMCQYGASTSMFASRINSSSKKLGLDIECKAYPESRLDEFVDTADVILLGPQIGYKKEEFVQNYPQYKEKFHVLNSVDFGTMNSEKVLKELFMEDLSND